MMHHQQTVAEHDPDAFHIRGGHFRSLLGALFFPEGSFVVYFRQKRAKIHVTEILARLALFVGMAMLGRGAFWVLWAVLRLNYGLSMWIFAHHLHYRHGEFGTFALMLPKPLKLCFRLVYGKAALFTMSLHHVHHRHPRVAAINLDRVE